jgi:hypothetical protein
MARKDEERRKLLRKQVFNGLVTMLVVIGRERRQLVLGLELGRTGCALASLPLVIETACRARAVPPDELKTIRQAWGGVRGLTGGGEPSHHAHNNGPGLAARRKRFSSFLLSSLRVKIVE